MTTRTPDYDLQSYLENNNDFFALGDIKDIHAEVPGHNDEMSWYWVIELKEPVIGGRFVLTRAWCDYTGWDCSSGGTSQAARTRLAAAKLAPEIDEGRKIRKNLLAQIRGTQPFGLEIMETAA